MARSSVKSIFSAVAFIFLGIATVQSTKTTVTMCDPDRHQEIDLQAPSSKHIQSPDYPSASPDTGGEACTVKLLVNNPVSVLFTVDGNFSIPESSGDCQYNARIWIGSNEYDDINTCLFCGTLISGYELCQITPDSQNWQNGITVGFRFNTWTDPRPQSYFRIKYAVTSSPVTTDSLVTLTTTENSTNIPVTSETTTNTKETSSTVTDGSTSDHLTSNTVISDVSDSGSPPSISVTKAANNTRVGGDFSNAGAVDADDTDSDSGAKIGAGVGSGVVAVCAAVVIVIVLIRRKPTWLNKAKTSKGESQADLDIHVYDDPAHLPGSGEEMGSTIVLPPCHNNDKCDSEEASYSKLAECYTAEVTSNTNDPSSDHNVYSNVDGKTKDEEAEYYNTETITRVVVEATLQDTYSSVLGSNKSSTKSAAAVRTTELVDNDLYGS